MPAYLPFWSQAVEAVQLLMVYYISVAATQIIPLVIRTEGLSLSAAGWIFGFCTPVMFNMFVLQQILAKCVLLRAVYELDADVAGT